MGFYSDILSVIAAAITDMITETGMIPDVITTDMITTDMIIDRFDLDMITKLMPDMITMDMITNITDTITNIITDMITDMIEMDMTRRAGQTRTCSRLRVPDAKAF